MIKEFSYPLPDELYIDSFDLGKKFFSQYNGPEKISILVDKLTNEVSGINPEMYNAESYDLFEIYSNKNPELSYFIMVSNDSWEYEYEEEIMENGDIYKKIVNPSLRDAYTLEYDREEKEFKLKLIIKTSESNVLVSSLIYFKNKLNYILSHEEGKKGKNEPLLVSEELTEFIKNFIELIDQTINENLLFPSWKYSNFETILESIIPFPNEIKNLLTTYE